MDVIWGLAQTPTIRGCRYYITFIDEYSWYTWIFLMKKKREVLCHFQKLKSQVEKPYVIFDAYDLMEERNTSLTNPSPISKVRE